MSQASDPVEGNADSESAAETEQPWGNANVLHAPTASRGASFFSELVEAEGVTFERATALFGLVISTVGAAVAVVAALLGKTTLGLGLLAVALIMTAYFGFMFRYLDRPGVVDIARKANPMVEMTIPPLLLLALLFTDGRAYALASWVPPMLFTAMLFLQCLRLRPWTPTLMGLYAAGWMAAFVWWIGPAVDPAPLPDVDAFSDRAQVMRCVTLILGGGFSGATAVAVRYLLRRGTDRLRQQELFGKYRLGSLLAEGGMGQILFATYCPEGGFERPVAIKRIHPHLAANERFVAAFRSEAELCARLNHPHIVQVMDFGRTEGTYFFAMELVEGLNLAELIRRARKHQSPLPGGLVAYIGLQICSALRYAHDEAVDSEGQRLRVVHRDLSPRNILVSRSGVVKITDFGIARALKDAAHHQTQALMGSLAYLSPEQAASEPVDPRSDLFSLGLVLRELLSGRSLFKRSNEAATLRAVLSEPIPSLMAERGDVDPAWGEVLSKALRRDPERRFQSATDLAATLAGLHEREGSPGAEALRHFLSPLLEEEAGELTLEDAVPRDPAVITVTSAMRGLVETEVEVDATRPDGGRLRPAPVVEGSAETES